MELRNIISEIYVWVSEIWNLGYTNLSYLQFINFFLCKVEITVTTNYLKLP